MECLLLTDEKALCDYDVRMRAHPEGTLWQSLAWKKFQEALGREVRIYVSEKWKVKSEKWGGSALVVIDRTRGGYSTWEIPRGPIVSEEWKVKSEKCEEFVQGIVEDAKKEKCLSLYYSPLESTPLSATRYSLSARSIHPQATRIIDLTLTHDDILAQMHPKGRYNIRVAEREGVVVEAGSMDDIDAFYKLLQQTGARDGFGILQKSHYERFLRDLEGSFMFIAKIDQKPIAGLIGVQWNHRGIYYYGASCYEYRNLMAPYLLQWEAMKLCKAAGSTSYDLLGISPEGASPRDPWHGISDFKRKFGGTVVTYPPEQEYVLRPVMKAALQWKRKVWG